MWLTLSLLQLRGLFTYSEFFFINFYLLTFYLKLLTLRLVQANLVLNPAYSFDLEKNNLC